MKYVIEVEEVIKRINSYTIEVEDEEEAEELLDNIENDINSAFHPDDVSYAICDAGYEIVEYCEGAEDCEYELL